LPDQKVGVVFEHNLKKIIQPSNFKPEDMKRLLGSDSYSFVSKMDKDKRAEFIKTMKDMRQMDKLMNPDKYKPIAAENIKLKNLIPTDYL